MTINSLTPARPPVARERAAADPGPDLIVERVEPDNAFPYAGDPVWFDVTVKNQGDRPAGANELRISAPGFLRTARVQQLAAGAEVTLRRLGPLWTQPGDSLIWIDTNVDTADEVSEKREDNNYLMSTLSVQAPFPPR